MSRNSLVLTRRLDRGSGPLRLLRKSPSYVAFLLAALVLGMGTTAAGLHLVGSGLEGLREPLFPAGTHVLDNGTNETAPAVMDEPPSARGWSTAVQTVRQVQHRDVRLLLRTLGGAALLALAIACSNLVVLLLARASVRRGEMTLRAVFGAGRMRLLGQLLAENGPIAFVASAFALALAAVGMAWLRQSWPFGLPRWLPDRVVPETWLLAFGIPLLVLLAFGLAPAAAAMRRNLHAALSTGGRATADRGAGVFRKLLVVGAVAAALMLLVSAGLLLRSFDARNPAVAEPQAQGVFTARLDLNGNGYTTPTQRAAFYAQLQKRLARVPGVEAESIASVGALVGLGTTDRVRVACGECSRGTMFLPIIDDVARHHLVGPGFFDTLGVPIAEGRDFSVADGVGAPPVAIINRAFANRLFPNGRPLGKQVRVGAGEDGWFTVVGIAENVRARGIGSGAQPEPAIYLPALQHGPRSVSLAVRSPADPERVAAAVRRQIAALDPHLAPTTGMPLAEYLARFRAPLRWFAGLFGVLATVAVLLTTYGLYGVVSYLVARRTREMGIRMALGARTAQIVALVLRQTLHLTAWGTALGLIGALSMARLLQVHFYGVNPLDGGTYLAVAGLLAAVMLLASWVPVRRAVRVNPAVALGAE